MSFLAPYYDWLKALHVISVIAWMAGLFYLPRLFVHHAERAQPGTELSETFKMMEMKLFRFIMRPSMISSWVFGLATAAALGWDYLVDAYWFHAKFLCVILMTGFHDACGRWLKVFAEDRNEKPGRYYRMMNEVPTVLMIVIVIMAVVEPF